MASSIHISDLFLSQTYCILPFLPQEAIHLFALICAKICHPDLHCDILVSQIAATNVSLLINIFKRYAGSTYSSRWLLKPLLIQRKKLTFTGGIWGTLRKPRIMQERKSLQVVSIEMQTGNIPTFWRQCHHEIFLQTYFCKQPKSRIKENFVPPGCLLCRLFLVTTVSKSIGYFSVAG